eukprot:GHVH01013863.1.p2 GENE.GHVH01013863.1~~GHVH01013863.1.p2  ORF type:complete len:216 (+),score=34.67 GHVH01013863.1:1022-1669(+)
MLTMISVRIAGGDLFVPPPKSRHKTKKRNIREGTRSLTDKYYIARGRLSALDGDLISMYNAMTACDTQIKNDADFMKENFIDPRKYHLATAWRMRLVRCAEELLNGGEPFEAWDTPESDEATLTGIKKKIFECNVLNVAYHEGEGRYKLLRHGSHRTSQSKPITIEVPSHGEMPSVQLSVILRVHPQSVCWFYSSIDIQCYFCCYRHYSSFNLYL